MRLTKGKKRSFYKRFLPLKKGYKKEVEETTFNEREV